MKYYKPEIECAPRSELEALQSYRLSRTVRRVYENVAPYRKKMDEAGVKPEDIKRPSEASLYRQAGPERQLSLRNVRFPHEGRCTYPRKLRHNRQADGRWLHST